MKICLGISPVTQVVKASEQLDKGFSEAVKKVSSKQSLEQTKDSSSKSSNTSYGKTDRTSLVVKKSEEKKDGFLNLNQPDNRQEIHDALDDESYFRNSKTVLPQDLEAIKKIGSGTFAKVYLCKSKISGESYALKVIEKSKLKTKNLAKYAINERNILIKVKSDFVVSLKLSFQTKTH
jgi:hypothetical protein